MACLAARIADAFLQLAIGFGVGLCTAAGTSSRSTFALPFSFASTFPAVLASAFGAAVALTPRWIRAPWHTWLWSWLGDDRLPWHLGTALEASGVAQVIPAVAAQRRGAGAALR